MQFHYLQLSDFPSPVPDPVAVPAACQCTRDANNLTVSALQQCGRICGSASAVAVAFALFNVARTAIAIFDG